MTPNNVDENELDLRGLCRALWQGKGWIVGGALLLALLALGYAQMATQVWSATAITDRAGVDALGGYYNQQQLVNNLSSDHQLNAAPAPALTDDVYKEFVLQLSAWDTRRDFWLQSPYYQQRKTGEAQADGVLLDRLISNIQYQPADALKGINDSVRLLTETAADASTLLQQYVAFANQRAVAHLNQSLAGSWNARRIELQAQVDRQQTAASAVYQRRLHSVQQALKIAQQQGVEQQRTSTPPEQVPEDELFLLGSKLLQARLDNLQATGPGYDLSYDQNQAMLGTLSGGPTLEKTFNCWRYLRTPEQPVKRDSPRQLFLMAMWGVVGAMIGAGVALARRRASPGLNH